MNLNRLKQEKIRKKQRKKVARKRLRILSLSLATLSGAALLYIGGLYVLNNIDLPEVTTDFTAKRQAERESEILGVNLERSSHDQLALSPSKSSQQFLIQQVNSAEAKAYVIEPAKQPTSYAAKYTNLVYEGEQLQLGAQSAIATIEKPDSFWSDSSLGLIAVSSSQIASEQEVLWELRDGSTIQSVLFMGSELFLLTNNSGVVELHLIQNFSNDYVLYTFRQQTSGQFKFLSQSEQDSSSNSVIKLSNNSKCYELDLGDLDPNLKKIDCPSKIDEEAALETEVVEAGSYVTYAEQQHLVPDMNVVEAFTHKDLIFIWGTSKQTKQMSVYFINKSDWEEGSAVRQLTLPDNVQKGQLAHTDANITLVANTVLGDQLYSLVAVSLYGDLDEYVSAEWQELSPEDCSIELCTLKLVYE